MSGGGGGSSGGGGGSNNRVGSGTGNLRGPGETNRQRFNRQVNSRIRSRNTGPNAAQAAFQANYRGWSIGQHGSWSGGTRGFKIAEELSELSPKEAFKISQIPQEKKKG